jgi:hypothetical protein
VVSGGVNVLVSIDELSSSHGEAPANAAMII